MSEPASPIIQTIQRQTAGVGHAIGVDRHNPEAGEVCISARYFGMSPFLPNDAQITGQALGISREAALPSWLCKFSRL